MNDLTYKEWMIISQFVLTQKSAKSQGCIPLCYTFSKILNKIELASLKQNFVFNGFRSKVSRSRNARPPSSDSAICSVDVKSDYVLGYYSHDNSIILTPAKNVASAGRGLQEARDIVASRYSDELWALWRYKLRSNLRRKLPCPSGIEDRDKLENNSSKESRDIFKRNRIIDVATAELGVHEATGRNDGKRVEEYLRYTNLGKGYPWCAAFVSWCYGQAGLPQPRNPWSPALFPEARTYWKQGRFMGLANLRMDESASKADIFGIYSRSAERINHVGLVKAQQGKYLVTIEGNSNNRVESRRRHLSTVYAIADWVSQ